MPRNGNRTWFTIKNLAGTQITDVSIYDEIGMYGVTAQDFIRDLAGVTGPVSLHLNTPGGEVFDGLAIYSALKAHRDVTVTIDGLAASIGSVIAMAASPGKLGIAKNGSMMIHDGFSQVTGNAQDMRKLADILEQQSDNIASIYADRTNRAPSYWRNQMKDETWFVGEQAVAAGLADRVIDVAAVQASWSDLSKFRNVPDRVLAASGSKSGKHGVKSVTHTHPHQAYGTQGGDMVHSHEHTHDNDAVHTHHAGASDSAEFCPRCESATGISARYCGSCGKNLEKARNAAATAGNNGWVADKNAPGGWRFDPDGDGDDDATPEGDTDHDYFDADGKQLKPIPPKPKSAPGAKSKMPVGDGDAPFPGAAQPFKKKKKSKKTASPPAGDDAPAGNNFDTSGFRAAFKVDNSTWDASKAMSDGADSDDPAAFYAGICAGRKAGEPKLQSSWALPYKYAPKSPPNAAAVRNALARIGQTQGLTNKEQAQSLLEGLMKKINPDYEAASDSIDTGMLQAFLQSLLADHPGRG